MQCLYEKSCTGCASLNISLARQQELKLSRLQHLTNLPIELISLGDGGFRSRGELVLEKNQLGFVHAKTHQLVPISECPQWTPDLNQYFKEIQRLNLEISGRGSIRIRTHNKLKGIWLDFANLEIKKLLDSKTQLLSLLDLGIVEIGQKRKILRPDQRSLLKLTDPEFYPWTQSFSLSESFDLYHSIGNFSQSGGPANRKIGEWVSRCLNPDDTVIEFGSGIGTLTLPALKASAKVLSVETDGLATQALKFTLKNYPELEKKWSYKIGNFQRSHKLGWGEFNCLIINPPRSGMGDFLNSLEKVPKNQRPKKILYMSCFFESFKTDLQKLNQLGFELTKIKILDQFPQTEHFEILSELRLS